MNRATRQLPSATALIPIDNLPSLKDTWLVVQVQVQVKGRSARPTPTTRSWLSTDTKAAPHWVCALSAGRNHGRMIPHASGRGYDVAPTARLDPAARAATPQDEAAAQLPYDQSATGPPGSWQTARRGGGEKKCQSECYCSKQYSQNN